MASERHEHLRRLDRLHLRHTVYFLTTCTAGRKPVLNDPAVVQILTEEWISAFVRHGWQIGRYVVMPDHVHFFGSPHAEAKSLPAFMGAWKQWTAKRLILERGLEAPVWQPEFFDHLLRSEESYSEKWDYIRANPVRAGLVADANDWPFQGFIHFA